MSLDSEYLGRIGLLTGFPESGLHGVDQADILPMEILPNLAEEENSTEQHD
jgi:hypothetical protein